METLQQTAKVVNRLNTMLLAFAYTCNALIARRYFSLVRTRESRRLMQAVGMATTVLAADQIFALMLDGGGKKRAAVAAVGRMILVGAIYFSAWRFWTSFVTGEDDASHAQIAHGAAHKAQAAQNVQAAQDTQKQK